jgi:hypothetical protein
VELGLHRIIPRELQYGVTDEDAVAIGEQPLLRCP